LKVGWRAKPKPRSRISLRLLSLVFLISACQEQIVHDLSEREANSVVSQLSMARLDARKVPQPDGRWAISVNQEEMIPAISFIETRRVLPSRDAKSGSSKGAMIPSREEQWFRYERSVALSIEESLSALPGVLDARVHVNLPDDDPLFGDSARGGGSGSVLLVVDRRFSAADDEVAALVGGAAGLSREVVRVLKSQTVEDDVQKFVEAPTLTSNSIAEVPISLVVVGWGVAGIATLGAAYGVRMLRRRSRRRVAFELPKELDFEG
jgi:type III secretion protein J